MNRHDATRRRLLRAGLGLAAGAAAASTWRFAGAARATSAVAPAVAFLDRAEAAAALADAPGDAYYARMGLLEIRARMKSALPGTPLADARVAVQAYDAAAVLPFTDAERAVISDTLVRLQPVLAARAPLYARTPWSFIKLGDQAEGGMPHTRGAHVVLPASVVDLLLRRHGQARAAGAQAFPPPGANLLVHEQTHVLERLHPERFEPLFTDVLGFTRMASPPAAPWLVAHRCVNPDGPDVAWAFPLEKIGGRGWLMPDVTLPDRPVPRLPQDFESVGVEVARGADGWRVVERDGQPARRDLDQVRGWHAYFPFPAEDFHPNEIAAVALSHWILRDVPDVDARPLMPALASWARTGLA